VSTTGRTGLAERAESLARTDGAAPRHADQCQRVRGVQGPDVPHSGSARALPDAEQRALSAAAGLGGGDDGADVLEPEQPGEAALAIGAVLLPLLVAPLWPLQCLTTRPAAVAGAERRGDRLHGTLEASPARDLALLCAVAAAPARRVGHAAEYGVERYEHHRWSCQRHAADRRGDRNDGAALLGHRRVAAGAVRTLSLGT
jgi:hypothetical protein